MKRLLKWIAGVLAVLLLAAFGVFSYLAGSPKDAYGMVRYALPRIGGVAARLLALDGTSHFHIRERLGARPLVLVFGSFT